MSMVNEKVNNLKEQGVLFARFSDRSTKYHSVTKAAKPDNGDFLDHYMQSVKNPHSPAFKFTVAAGVGVVLGGLGLIFGRRGLGKFRETLSQMAADLGKRAKEGDFFTKTKAAIVNGASKFLNGYYALEKGRDVGLMQGLRAIDFGFKKIGMSFLTPGKWLVDASKWSLLFTGGSLKKFYGWARESALSAKSVLSENLPKVASQKERRALSKAQSFLKNEKLDTIHGCVDDLHKGMGERLKGLRKEVEENVIPAYLGKYFPTPRKIFSLSEWKKEFGKVRTSWGSAFSKRGPDNTDILRENWVGVNGIEARLRSRIVGSDTKLGRSLDELDEIVKGLEEFSKNNPVSNEFKNIHEALNKTRNSVRHAVNFEVSGMDAGRFTGSYAGRVIDLGAGGGITETLIPIITLGLLGTNAIKHSEKEDSAISKTKKFLGNGGFECLGSIGAWFTMAVVLGINGPPAIVAAFATALGLNITKRTFNKVTGKEKKKESKIDPKQQQQAAKNQP